MESSNDGNSGWEDIGSGTTYQIKGKDQNKHIRVVVTYKANGQAGNRTFPKNASRAVPNFVNQDYTIHETETTAPNKDVTNSTSQIGKTLSVFTRNDPRVDKDGETDTTYQWQRYDGVSNWDNITGETAKTYTVKGPDENKKLRAKVSFHYSGLGPITVDTTNEIEIDDFVLQDYIVTGEAENGKKLTVNETEKKLPVGTIDSISYQWQCSSDDGISWTNVGTDNKKYTVEDQNKLIRVIVTFGVSTLQITDKVVTVNVQQPDFIIFGLGKDAVNLDDYDLRDVNLSHTNIESMDNAVVNDNTNFTGTNLKGLDTTTLKNETDDSTLSITDEKQDEIDFSKTLRSKSYDLSGKDLRGYDLTGMIITSLKNAIINSTTNLSHINAEGADMSYIVE